MVFERRAVGVDLGASHVKVVELRLSGSAIAVTRALRVERSELLREGDSAAALARALRSQLSGARISCRSVVLGIGGQDSIIRYTKVSPVPPWRLQALMKYEVDEIAEKVGEPLASDFQLLQLPRELEEDQTILLALSKEKPLSELLGAFEAEGITVAQVVPGPLGVFMAHDSFGAKVDPDAEEQDVTLIADMGAENLCLALVLNGRLAFARGVSFGGKNFTDALAQHLRIDPIEAERTKIARGGLTTEERGVLHESVRPLAGIAGQFFGLLESSLRYASTQTGTKLPELSRIVLLGGGMRLRGMEAFLSRGFGVPAGFFAPPALRIASPASQQAAREISERPSDFGLALGLAAAGLRDGGQQGPVKSCVSVVPSAYVERRAFRERTLFLYAAGAILLVALLVRFAHGYLRNSEARAVQRDLAAAASRLEGLKKELDDMTVATEVRKARLNRLLREAEQTSFQAYMLDLLSRVLRPEMQLQRVFLDDGAMTPDGTSSDYTLHIEGRVSNEKQQGIEWISSLQRLLREEERIGSVEEVPADSDRIWRNFKLLVKPNYIRY